MSASRVQLDPDVTRSLRKAETAVAALDAAMEVNSPSAVVTTLAPGATTLDVPDGERVITNVPQTPTAFLSYEIGPKIGAGGMGTVHRATHVWLGRTVAIKFITPTLFDNPEMAERFRHEALAVGRLHHPHIVQATDAGNFEGTHFLVTEFVPGDDLASLVRRRGRMEVADACEAVRQAALGLAHAHEQGIIHRDVKPGNLLLRVDGTVKVLDFGLARMAAGQTMLTNTGQVLGTLDFLAPEQAHDARHVDARSDQYSLGCTLYFLLTGSPPFSGPAYDTPASKLKAHLIDHPTPISELRHRVPLALSAVLDRMLAKNPKDRFASLIEVAESLGPLCRGAELATLVGGTGTAFHKHRKAAGGWSGTEFLDRAASVLGWALRGGYRRSAAVDGPKHSHRPQIFSLSGLVVLGFLAFVLSRVSCVEIKEEGPAGTGGTPEEARIIEFGFGNSTPPPAFPFRPVQPNQTTDKTGQNGR